jgi:hypothetical protein
MGYRIAVLNDVHSNVAALKAVLSDAQRRGPFDAKVCAGDIIGYGPDPNAVIELLGEEGVISVMGNHDRLATVDGDAAGFNLEALAALSHNLAQLTPINRAYLTSLEMSLQYEQFSVTHSSFDWQRNGTFNFEYVTEPRSAERSLISLY